MKKKVSFDSYEHHRLKNQTNNSSSKSGVKLFDYRASRWKNPAIKLIHPVLEANASEFASSFVLIKRKS